MSDIQTETDIAYYVSSVVLFSVISTYAVVLAYKTYKYIFSRRKR